MTSAETHRGTSERPACPSDPFASPESEQCLLERLRAGEDAAYDVLVRAAGGRMLAAARRILDNEEDARQAVQDAFISAFQAIDRFEGRARLTTWLHRVTVNAALMIRRSKARRPERSIEDLLPRFREDGHRNEIAAAWTPLPDEALESSETRAMVRRLMAELPDIDRTILLLRDIEGLDTAAAAEALGISDSAVKTRLHRARQALRTLLERELVG